MLLVEVQDVCMMFEALCFGVGPHSPVFECLFASILGCIDCHL